MNKVKVILPSICFAVLSTPAFEKVIHAAEINTPASEVNQFVASYQYVDVDPRFSLNLRESASTSARVIGKLSNGTQVPVLSVSNGWAKIQVNGKVGYVSTAFLSEAKPSSSINTPAAPVTYTKTQYVNVGAGSKLNVRSGGSMSASVTTQLPEGTQVTVYSVSSGWAKISANGKSGYVSQKYLSDTKPGTTANPAPAVPPVSSTKTQFVNVGTGSNLNVRSGSSTSTAVIAQLPDTSQVTVYSVSNGWAKISANGKSGYVSQKYLSDTKPGTTVNPAPTVPPVSSTKTQFVNVGTGSNLNVRSGSSTSTAVIAQLPNAAQVTVYSVSNGWAKISVNGKDGYVSEKYLSDTKPGSTVNPTPTVPPETTLKYVDVPPTTSLNMRKGPSTNQSIILKLARGIEVTILSEGNGWAKIKAYGQEGYVSTEFLSNSKPGEETQEQDPVPPSDENSTEPENNTPSEPEKETGNTQTPAESENQPDNQETPAESTTVLKYVNVDTGVNLNVRSGPSTNHKVITKLASGTVVTVYAEENGWASISANGQRGFVSTQYLSEKIQTSPDTSTQKINTVYQDYNVTLDQLTQMQMKANPQTDKEYATYIREDALILNDLTNPTLGTVNGTWNIRGGAGTENWVVGKVNYGQKLQILSRTTGSDGYIWYQVDYNKSWVNASPEDVEYYLDPTNFINNPVASFQFLKLSETTSLDQFEVNERILAGKGILEGHAATFIAASEKYKINDIYLISHALLETGNGRSELANGVEVYGKTVYNMFGIGAYDGNAIATGANFAYNAGWFTPEAAIIGGAQFIANGYISNGQDTIYKMRWNPDAAVTTGVATHQYATDIGWATKQVNQIYNLYSLLEKYKVTFEIPSYKL